MMADSSLLALCLNGALISKKNHRYFSQSSSLLGAWREFPYVIYTIHKQSHEVPYIITINIQMGKLRFREVKNIGQDHNSPTCLGSSLMLFCLGGFALAGWAHLHP